MKRIVLIVVKVLICIIGGIYIVTSLDAIASTNSFIVNLIHFTIQSSFGLILIILTIFLRKKELILGIVYLLFGCFFFFFFEVYNKTNEKLFIVLVFIVPLLIGGITHLLFSFQAKRNN